MHKLQRKCWVSAQANFAAFAHLREVPAMCVDSEHWHACIDGLLGDDLLEGHVHIWRVAKRGLYHCDAKRVYICRQPVPANYSIVSQLVTGKMTSSLTIVRD